MSRAALQAYGYFLIRSLQVTDPQLHSGAEPLAVTLLQRRAGQHRILIFRRTFQQLRMDRSQPRLAVFVAQRNPALHLLNILRGVKIVRIQKQPAQSLGEKLSQGRLSRPGYSHHQKNHLPALSPNRSWFACRTQPSAGTPAFLRPGARISRNNIPTRYEAAATENKGA